MILHETIPSCSLGETQLRSLSNDNKLHCSPSIEALKEKFNSPSYIVEPGVKEVRQMRILSRNAMKGEEENKENIECTKKRAVIIQHNASAKAKGFSAPETKAANEEIGIIAPKKEYYEQLCSKVKNVKTAPSIAFGKRQAVSLDRGCEKLRREQLPPLKPRSVVNISIDETNNNNSNNLTSNCAKSPKLQRRTFKLATEIKICYDSDCDDKAQQLNNQNSIKQKQLTLINASDLETIPLPPIPSTNHVNNISQQEKQMQHQTLESDNTNCAQMLPNNQHTNLHKTVEGTKHSRIIPVIIEPSNGAANTDDISNNSNIKQPKLAACTHEVGGILLQAIDLNNQHTIAYIPATICKESKIAKIMDTTSALTTNAATTAAQPILNSSNDKQEDSAVLYISKAPMVRTRQLPRQTSVASLQLCTDENYETANECQTKFQVAAMEQKYHEIQKSIEENLRQIDEYMEAAKLALQLPLDANSEQAENITEMALCSSTAAHELLKLYAGRLSPLIVIESPLKLVLKELKSKSLIPSSATTDVKTEELLDKAISNSLTSNAAAATVAGGILLENVPVVDKALSDLTSITSKFINTEEAAAESIAASVKQEEPAASNKGVETQIKTLNETKKQENVSGVIATYEELQRAAMADACIKRNKTVNKQELSKIPLKIKNAAKQTAAAYKHQSSYAQQNGKRRQQPYNMVVANQQQQQQLPQKTNTITKCFQKSNNNILTNSTSKTKVPLTASNIAGSSNSNCKNNQNVCKCCTDSKLSHESKWNLKNSENDSFGINEISTCLLGGAKELVVSSSSCSTESTAAEGSSVKPMSMMTSEFKTLPLSVANEKQTKSSKVQISQTVPQANSSDFCDDADDNVMPTDQMMAIKAEKILQSSTAAAAATTKTLITTTACNSTITPQLPKNESNDKDNSSSLMQLPSKGQQQFNQHESGDSCAELQGNSIETEKRVQTTTDAVATSVANNQTLLSASFRKYPAALIEPHAATSRAVSPFIGVTSILGTGDHCNSQKASAANNFNTVATQTYVPQHESHDIGLLVYRALSPLAGYIPIPPPMPPPPPPTPSPSLQSLQWPLTRGKSIQKLQNSLANSKVDIKSSSHAVNSIVDGIASNASALNQNDIKSFNTKHAVCSSGDDDSDDADQLLHKNSISSKCTAQIKHDAKQEEPIKLARQQSASPVPSVLYQFAKTIDVSNELSNKTHFSSCSSSSDASSHTTVIDVLQSMPCETKKSTTHLEETETETEEEHNAAATLPFSHESDGSGIHANRLYDNVSPRPYVSHIEGTIT